MIKHRACSSQQLWDDKGCSLWAPCIFSTAALLDSRIVSTHPNPRKLSSSSSSQAGTGQICSSKDIPSCFPSSTLSSGAMQELQHPGMLENLGNPRGSAGGSSFPWKSRERRWIPQEPGTARRDCRGGTEWNHPRMSPWASIPLGKALLECWLPREEADEFPVIPGTVSALLLDEQD